MNRTTLIFAACMLPTLSAAAVIDEVRCREIGFSAAAEARDADLFASFIDADARFVGARVYRGVDEIVVAWQPFFEEAGPRIRWRPRFVEILDDGKLALTRGPYRMTAVGEDGDVTEQTGIFNSVWRLNDDGAWRVVFDSGSPTPLDDEDLAILDAPDDCEPVDEQRFAEGSTD